DRLLGLAGLDRPVQLLRHRRPARFPGRYPAPGAGDPRGGGLSPRGPPAPELLLLQERPRLARELHDSLGHTVNVMVLQAGVGRRVFADNPTFAQEALSSIETVGRAPL